MNLRTRVSQHFASATHHLPPEVRCGCELQFVGSALSFGHPIPHGGRKNDILQCILATKFLEHEQILLRRTLHSHIADAMQVHYATQLDVRRIRVGKSRGKLSKDLRIAAVRIVESGGVNEVESGTGIKRARIDRNHGCA